ncbi:MAG: hypothetical protein Q4F21_11060, partial [Lachnospiraceae bacterium]|nr:hypothetical protein [Lachnospiraceae bacterium]
EEYRSSLDETEEYRNRLMEILADTLLELADERQMLSFYQVKTAGQNAVIAAGMAAVLHEMNEQRFGRAEKLLNYICSYRDCFLHYPDLSQLAEFLQKMLLQARSRSLTDSVQELIQRFTQLVLQQKLDDENQETAFLEIQRFYQRKTENEQEKQLERSLLQYCEAECLKLLSLFRLWTGGTECHR